MIEENPKGIYQKNEIALNKQPTHGRTWGEIFYCFSHRTDQT